MINIDGDLAIELLKRQVSLKGSDYIYKTLSEEDGYQYTHEGECSCLIGYALHEAGVSLHVLNRLDTEGRMGSALPIHSWRARKVLLEHGVILTQDAAEIFRVAQDSQDNGREWGGAVKAATELHEWLYS